MKNFIFTLVAILAVTVTSVKAETTYYLNPYMINLEETESVVLNNDIIVLCLEGHADTNSWDGRFAIQARHGKNIKHINLNANHFLSFTRENGTGWCGEQHAYWDGPYTAAVFATYTLRMGCIEVTVE